MCEQEEINGISRVGGCKSTAGLDFHLFTDG